MLCGALALTGAAAVYRSAPARAETAQDRFAELEGTYNARLGVFAVGIRSPRVVAYRDGERFAMASMFKAYVAACVLNGVDHGRWRLDTAVSVTAGDILPNSPVTEQAIGATLTMGQLCEATLQLSDNAAANLLLRALGGPAAITDFAREIGDEQTRLDRWEPELNSAIPGDPRDTTTPAAFGSGLRALLAGPALSTPSREQLVTWMRGTKTSDTRIRAGLPPGWTSADKTGTGDYGTTNDAGMVLNALGPQFILVVLSDSRAGDPDAAALTPLIAEATKVVVTEFA